MEKYYEGRYRPLAKRLALTTKVTRRGGIEKIIPKMIVTSTGATMYFLIYGIEAVLPIMVEISSMRILAKSKLQEVDWVKLRYK